MTTPLWLRPAFLIITGLVLVAIAAWGAPLVLAAIVNDVGPIDGNVHGIGLASAAEAMQHIGVGAVLLGIGSAILRGLIDDDHAARAAQQRTESAVAPAAERPAQRTGEAETIDL